MTSLKLESSLMSQINELKEEIIKLKEKNGVAGLGLTENAAQVLLGFTNVLTDHTGQVDFVQVQSQLMRQNRSGHGLTRAARAGEEDV